uniref:Methyltransf_21 domain-containing protein n=1 Tax=Globodera pallida TaxID=36090 RepID=A0A183CN97_GLOPA
MATYDFQHALELQKQGLAELKLEDGQLDLKGTCMVKSLFCNGFLTDVEKTEAAVRRQLVNQIGIREFLHNYTKGFPVDLLLVDIEGAEFGIFEQLADHYEQFPVPICQMNIEASDPLAVHHLKSLIANYTHEHFFKHFDRLLRAGRFALMNTEMYTELAPQNLFLLLFLVNVGQELCTPKFLC